MQQSTADRPRSANGSVHSGAEEARIAREIVRILRPASVLDASSSALLQHELRGHGVAVSNLHDMDASADPAVDLVICVPSLGRIDLDMVARIEQFSDRILFIGSAKSSPPLLSWLVSFAVSGFVPDTGFDPGALGSPAVLLQRGIVWPPEALRVFVETMPLRDPLQRILELETELAILRRQSITPLEMYEKDIAAAGLDLFQTESEKAARPDAEVVSALQTRLDTMEGHILELCRSNESIGRDLQDMLHSRTWRALIAFGNVLLRMTGRRS